MKKIVVLLIVATLCMCLFACGGDSTTGNGADTIESTENNAFTNHPHLQFVYGEWEYEGDNPQNYPFRKVNINEDGTCLVDGTAGTWNISNSTAHGRLNIDIVVEGQTLGVVEIYISSGRYNFNIANTMISQNDNWKHNTPVVADDNDIVLTAENWRDYFDLVTEAQYETNEFGDVDRLVLSTYLLLKDEYADKVIATDVIYEKAHTSTNYNIQVDGAGKSYTLEKTDRTFDSSAPEISRLFRDSMKERYQIRISNAYVIIKDNNDPESSNSKTVALVPDIEAIEMKRIQGTLYIANE